MLSIPAPSSRRITSTVKRRIRFDSSNKAGATSTRRLRCRSNTRASSLAAGHLTLVPALKQELAEQGRPDILIVIGGVIPPQDYDELRAAGAAAIFPPGTVIAEAAAALIEKLNQRLGHGRQAAE